MVEEKRAVGFFRGVQAVFTSIFFQYVRSAAHDRDTPYLLSFACQLYNIWLLQAHVPGPQVAYFLYPCSGIIQEGKERKVAAPIPAVCLYR